MHNLIILSKDAEAYHRLIATEKLPDLEIIATCCNQEEIEHVVRAGDEPFKKCEIVFGDPTLIRKALPYIPGLLWVQSTWAGVEPLIEKSLSKNYLLTNARGVFGELMSEYVFSYLLLHERRILERLEAQQKQIWDNSITGSLKGKIIGLLGVGSIGAHLAATAKHFGMQVRGFTRTSQICEHIDAYFHGEGLRAFADGLDYLVSTLPNTPLTTHFINSNLFSWLPERAMFINAGRGRTLDESALVAALTSGQIASAVLDVFNQEPLPPGHILWNTPNLFITFHTSAPSILTDLVALFKANYLRYQQDLPLLHLIDFAAGY